MTEVKVLVKGWTTADSKEPVEESTGATISLVIDKNIKMVVDPGVLENQQILVNALKKEGLSIDDINYVCLTHSHIDHFRNIGMFPKAKSSDYWGLWDKNTLKFNTKPRRFTEDIEIVPFEFMRGRTFNDAAVIVDECQSTTEEEICLLVTRIGENSKLVMLGDVRQKDIKNYSGLEYVIQATQQNSSIRRNVALVEFTLDDIVRSDVCALWAKHIYRS